MRHLSKTFALVFFIAIFHCADRTNAQTVLDLKQDQGTHEYEKIPLTLPKGKQSIGLYGYATAIQNKTVAISSPYEKVKHYQDGVVYLFEDGKFINTLLPSTPMPKAFFGSSLAFLGDIIAVGAPGQKRSKLISAGAVYLFQKNENGKWKEIAVLEAIDAMAGDFFGASLAFIDANTLAVGAHLNDSLSVDAGAVYIFRKDSDGAWQQTAKLAPDSLKASSLFGNSLSAHDGILAVGAYGFEQDIPGLGSVFLFEKIDTDWSLIQQVTPPNNKAFAEFGWNVTLSDRHLFVSAPYDDNAMRSSGRVHVYQRNDKKFELLQTLTHANPQARFGASIAYGKNYIVISAGLTDVVLYRLQGETFGRAHQFTFDAHKTDRLYAYTLSAFDHTIVFGTPSAQPELAGAAIYIDLPQPILPE